jgi:hypothetical protein
LYVEDLFSSPGQPPTNYVDVFDDALWFDRLFRSPKLLGFLPIEQLAMRLHAEATAEYQRRADAEPEERRAQRLERERRLQELVLRAIETDDPELWRRVDVVVSGQNAPTEAL